MIENLDLDRFYEAIGFEPFATVKDNDIGYCLFPENHSHGDTTGKFAIHRGKKVYSCFRCGGGSLLSLVIELYGWTPEASIQWMRQFAFDDTRSNDDFVHQLKEMLAYKGPVEAPLPYFNERVLDKFVGPSDYFLNRGISQQVVDECKLKYAENTAKTAPIRMRNGAPTKIDEDYYGDAAIFPHFWQDRLVGWQSRWIDYGTPGFPKWLAKYTNTSSFPKSNTLFNYAWALDSDQPVVVCESVPTTLFLRSLNIPAVAYFGDAPSEVQLKLMRKFNQGVILAPDNDTNGDRLLRVATDYLQSYIDVWHLPKIGGADSHMDMGDFAFADDPLGAVQEYLDRAEISYIACAGV